MPDSHTAEPDPPCDCRGAARQRRTLRSPRALAEHGLLPAGADLATLERAAAAFAVVVPPAIAELIHADDPDDPVGRQFLPAPEELEIGPGESADPIGDDSHSPVPGIVHRYRDRVLLNLTALCAVNCRFCFRRDMLGGAAGLDATQQAAALAYIAAHPEVWEVILTGGDPLVLSPRRLAGVAEAIDAIGHVGVLRIHSRVPIAAPERITPELVAALSGRRAAVWMMIHCNHWRELTPAVRAVCDRLAAAGIPLLAQTVLLKGINDDVETLTRTFRALVEARIKPHYLHHGDLARGTGHFRTTLEHGRALTAALRGDLSGLCQPTYVLDIPGGHGKVPAAAPWVQPDGTGGWTAADPHGRVHPYKEQTEST
jgi:lysine 2,3-aminomutase